MSKCSGVCFIIFRRSCGVGSLVTIPFCFLEFCTSGGRCEVAGCIFGVLRIPGSLRFGPFGVFRASSLGCSDFCSFDVSSNLLLYGRCILCRVLLKKVLPIKKKT